MASTIDRLKKVATLGGKVRLNKSSRWLYGLESTPGLSKESLFGMQGPLHPGMPRGEKIAVEATSSDTRATLVRELMEQGGLGRREAEAAIESLLKKGILKEVDIKDLGKVIVTGGSK